MWSGIGVRRGEEVRDYDAKAALAQRIAEKRGARPIATLVGRLIVGDPTQLPLGQRLAYGASLETTSIKDISAENIVAVNRGKPLTVCDALRNRALFNGSFVEVRGRFYGNSLGDQCESLRTQNFEWSPLIELELPKGSVVNDPPATWNIDIGWYSRIVADATRIGARSGKANRPTAKMFLEEPVYGPALSKYLGIEDTSPMATVIGRFDSRPDIDFMLSDGPIRFGYGHLGGLAARLVIVDVRNIAAFKAPEPSKQKTPRKR